MRNAATGRRSPVGGVGNGNRDDNCPQQSVSSVHLVERVPDSLTDVAAVGHFTAICPRPLADLVRLDSVLRWVAWSCPAVEPAGLDRCRGVHELGELLAQPLGVLGAEVDLVVLLVQSEQNGAQSSPSEPSGVVDHVGLGDSSHVGKPLS